jgi:taurine dioxygenase
MTNTWKIERLSGAIGAEISGVALAKVSREDIAHIKDLLVEHMVLFFPGQNLSIDQHVEFGSYFGEVEGHPNISNPYTQHDKIFELNGVANEWHTDLTFQDNPALLSVLNMVRCPEVGGDTMWCNLVAAYEAMSAPMQSLCDGLSALHDALPHNKPELMAIHPVVRLHPDTGKRALYVNEHFTRRIVEMNASESQVLLKYLCDWVSRPEFTVRYRWSEGAVGMWDNRCTQHFVVNDFEGERVVQRVTIMGDKPESDKPTEWPPFARSERGVASSRHDRQLLQFLESESDSQ